MKQILTLSRVALVPYVSDGASWCLLSDELCSRNSPRNYTLSDADFHNSNIKNPITIEAMIGELVDDCCSLGNYGHYLRDWTATR
jgi:hypothetical protein